MPEPAFHCDSCGTRYSVEQLLSACRTSWPNQQWLLFEFARCSATWHVEVADGRIAVGELDGAPGPCFFPKEAAPVPGLHVLASPGGISVKHGKNTTFVPAKR